MRTITINDFRALVRGTYYMTRTYYAGRGVYEDNSGASLFISYFYTLIDSILVIKDNEGEALFEGEIQSKEELERAFSQAFMLASFSLAKRKNNDHSLEKMIRMCFRRKNNTFLRRSKTKDYRKRNNGQRNWFFITEKAKNGVEYKRKFHYGEDLEQRKRVDERKPIKGSPNAALDDIDVDILYGGIIDRSSPDYDGPSLIMIYSTVAPEPLRIPEPTILSEQPTFSPEEEEAAAEEEEYFALLEAEEDEDDEGFTSLFEEFNDFCCATPSSCPSLDVIESRRDTDNKNCCSICGYSDADDDDFENDLGQLRRIPKPDFSPLKNF